MNPTAVSARSTETGSHSARLTTRPARFHLSLNVRDLSASVAFLQALCGCEPLKRRADYAKFELDDPPLVLSLEPGPFESGGALNHLGFRAATSEDLVEVQRRLELAGITTRREEGVECCYARQTKFWVHDPDGNLWEVYTLDEDLEHRGGGLPVVESKPADAHGVVDGAIWKHRIGQPFPARLPILDATVDSALLEGTFNERLDAAQTAARIAELRRILKPGGRLHLHLLTAAAELGELPSRLPGPAAVVRQVPHDEVFLESLRTAGFEQVRYAYRAASACFQVAGVELRETRVEAVAPGG